MTKKQADKVLEEQLYALKDRADRADSDEKFTALNDAILKVYLMMCNAGSFDDGIAMTFDDISKMN